MGLVIPHLKSAFFYDIPCTRNIGSYYFLDCYHRVVFFIRLNCVPAKVFSNWLNTQDDTICFAFRLFYIFFTPFLCIILDVLSNIFFLPFWGSIYFLMKKLDLRFSRSMKLKYFLLYQDNELADFKARISTFIRKFSIEKCSEQFQLIIYFFLNNSPLPMLLFSNT